MSCCCFISINNITIQEHIEYAIICYNMVGVSHLNSITIYTRNETSYGILLCLDDDEYTDCGDEDKTIFVTNILIRSSSLDHTFANKAVHIEMMRSTVNVVVRNSVFSKCVNAEAVMRIAIHRRKSLNHIFITNCSFSHNKQYSIYACSLVDISIYSIYTNVTLLNCTFNMNAYIGSLVRIDSKVAINATLMDITFNGNMYCELIRCTCFIKDVLTMSARVLLTGIFINGTHSLGTNDYMILIENSLLHLNGNVIITNNTVRSIITVYSSIVTFSENITFFNNKCFNIIELISPFSYISVLEYSIIVFESNHCYKEIFVVETVNTLYPYCLFQFVGPTVNLTALEHQFQLYSIKLITNSQQQVSPVNYRYYTSYCRWLESGAAFKGYDAEEINRNIIHNYRNDLALNQHVNLCYCPHIYQYNCTTDILGCAFPGQTMQVELCTPFRNETGFSFMYVETQNIVIQNVTCKVAHETEYTAEIGRQTTKIKFTIVSNKTDQCSLFLTAQPYLYKYYDVFQVQLLPCPIGFTLLNGICDCDPYLVNSDLQINTCYINELAIQSPANSWIVYQNGISETQYLISLHCPVDYCSPSTTKLNLVHPDSQCQFHRTGLLCSQCQNGLSMIFGSSRCMRCTNVYLLLSIVVLIAGVILVMLLYCLNLTVTKGTINEIIFYANIISINGSVFLVNDNVYKPLKVFISFTNLDLGIETCFYNGMDSYAKMWLQLLFPFYLIMMATLLIITSRYSTRIQ